MSEERRLVDIGNIVSCRLETNSKGVAGRCCFCNAVGAGEQEVPKVPVESDSMTECIISSLNTDNCENVISLLQNYISAEYLALGNVSLRNLIAFSVNTNGSEPQKFRVKSALDDQLKYHPACAAYMSQTYHALLLAKDENFSNLTILDYVLGKLEQSLSNDEIRNTDHRTSRRHHQPKIFFDDSPKKQPKKEPESIVEKVNMQYVFSVLDFLVQIVKHDFGVSVGRSHRKVTDSIIAKIILKSDNVLHQNDLLRKIFELYRMYYPFELRRSLSNLVFVIADLCALVESRVTFDYRSLSPLCWEVVHEFQAIVLDEIFSQQWFSIVTQLQPEWLRFHVTQYAIEKLIEKKIPTGIEGALQCLQYLKKTAIKVQQSQLKLSSDNEFENPNNVQSLEGTEGKIICFYNFYLFIFYISYFRVVLRDIFNCA